jgi:hypothetical protein
MPTSSTWQRARHLQLDQVTADAIGGVAAHRADPVATPVDAATVTRDAAPSRSATAA